MPLPGPRKHKNGITKLPIKKGRLYTGEIWTN